MGNDYATAWDALADTIGAAKGENSGSITDMAHLSTENRLKAIEIAALLSISQELSALNPANTITPGDSDGQKKPRGTPRRIY